MATCANAMCHLVANRTLIRMPARSCPDDLGRLALYCDYHATQYARIARSEGAVTAVFTYALQLR